MRRPPAVLIFLSVLLLALGATGGALMSALRPQIRQAATEHIFAARETHYLSGSRDYDAEVVSEIVFTIEAGLSFFHTHGEGIGLVLLLAATLVASLVRRRWLRAGLQWLLGVSALFPLGYLAYSVLILMVGRDRGVALAEQLLLLPAGSSAIVGLAALVGVVGLLFVSGRRARLPNVAWAPTVPTDPERSGAPGWRRPPPAVMFAAALLIALAEIGGAAMGRFRPEIEGFAIARAQERPELHGLAGTPDVDGEILDEVRVKVDGALRLFHLHGEGVGLMVFAGALVVATFAHSVPLRVALYALLTVGGLGFPFGYLAWSILIPFLGIDAARAEATGWVLVPFGALFLVALWVLPFVLARALLARRRPAGAGDRGAPEAVAADRRSLSLPPLGLVLAAVLLLVLAEVGGAVMTKLKLDLDRAHRVRIEARPLVHGLVGVRQIDGPVMDALLARADSALRLFHLHGEGMALVMLAGGVIVRNFVAFHLLAGLLHALLAVGGFLYPFGYLAWGLLIPTIGLQPARDLAELFFWIPFGGAALLAMALTALVLAAELLVAVEPRRRRW